MRKTTPIILTMIMLMSAFASIGWSELDEMKTSNDADARAGPDGDITDITEPRATAVDPLSGDMTHEIDAGDSVNFEIFITNSGDQDITRMGITVTVYEDPDGQPGGLLGPVATDSNGNQLIWQNNDVICDDAWACPQTTLAPSAVLDQGSYLMTVQGSIVTWVPEVGDYQIMVELDAMGGVAGDVADAQPDNNMMKQFVSVADWTDVIIDLQWSSEKDVEGGSGDKDFSLSVRTDGSISWQARNITVALEITGALTNAVYWTDADGDNLTGGSHHGGENGEEASTDIVIDSDTTTNFAEIGNFENVVTWENGADKDDNTTDDRWNMRSGSVWILNGTVTPNSGVADGTYAINAQMVSYTIFGKFSPDCERETNASGSGSSGGLNATTTVLDGCEITKQQDNNPATSEDMLEGAIANYHDMSVFGMVINQGYATDDLNADGFPMYASGNPGLRDGPLQPGLATVQAKVSHNGNDPTAASLDQQYHWNITFEITDRSTGVTTTNLSNECYNGESAGGQAYRSVGGGNPIVADACYAYIFTPGAYDIVATVSFELRGQSNKDDNSFNDNDEMNSIAVLNNRPTVTLSIGTTDEIIVGDINEIQFEADANDIEDPTGESLTYTWSYPEMGEESPFDGIGKDYNTMSLSVMGNEMVGYRQVTITVNDGYSSASDTLSFRVWNHIVADSTSDSGIKMIYDLTYVASDPFSINLTDSAKGYPGQTLSGYTGTYNSVAVLDYVPSTVYLDPTYVLSQSISLEYDSTNLNPTSVWYVLNGIWIELSTSSDTTGTVGTITIDLGANSPTVGGGEIVLMTGDLVQAEPPAAHPMGFTMSAAMGGNIGMAWSYQGSYVAGVDWVEIILCEDTTSCASPTVIKPGITETAHSLSGQGSTTHGITYYATIRVCNDAGCNGIEGSANATADSQVDGHPTATAITVANGDGVWTVSWTATGVTDDVKNWKVCYDDSSWAVAGDMPGNCVNAADGATSADITMSTVPGTKKFYFTAVPVDSMGNYDTAVSGADIDYIGVDETPGQGSGTDVGSTTDVDGAVPSWTWGVIIGIVVVAFVVGAFILSRGGEGDEGKDWDY